MDSTLRLLANFLLFLSIVSCERTITTKNQEKSDTYEQFVSEMQARGFNTGNILVYENGQVVFQSANGLQSNNPSDSLTLNSQFRIASVSKQFTGVAIMKLKQAGSLDYDQEVNTILTDFPYEGITIRHLLSHISGLPDYEEIIDENYIPQNSSKRDVLGNKEIMKTYFEVNPELNFRPGENWEYSNTGYMILASIVEKIANQHFRDFLSEHIFEPLEMKNTLLYQYQESKDPSMPNRVFGYEKALNQKDYNPYDYHVCNDVRGDGGIYSTLEDLFKWNMALVNYEVLPKEYLDEAWAWGSLNNGDRTRYGFGWKFPKDQSAPKAIFHSGGWVGFGAFLYNEIETKSGYMVLTNDSWESFISITDAIDSIRIGAKYIVQKRSIGKDMMELLFSDDVDKAISFYRNNKIDTAYYFIDENELNNLGYDLMNNSYLEEALMIFKLNLDEYPLSANTYDSYGDALWSAGQKSKALANYEIAFKMDSSLMYTKDKILQIKSELI